MRLNRTIALPIVTLLALFVPSVGRADPANAPSSANKTAPAKKSSALRGAKKAWHFAADRRQVALLEMYTSQECNTCPQGDAMIAKLRSDGFGFDKVVPLAFHVSYWPHLGWTDRYSRPEFAERHEKECRKNSLDKPYTPEIFLNGRERLERDAALRKAVEVIAARPPVLKLDLIAELSADGRMLEIFTTADRSTLPNTDRRPAVTFVALFEMGLSMRINAGENKGKTLAYDYVVRLISPEHEFKPTDDMMPTGDKIRLDPTWKVEKLGVAAFVQQTEDAAVMQAVGGLLDPAQAKPAEEE